ncbi:basic salivary proline-rich protein 2-like, partial [Chiloscyllium plagiosum]|uniref:basic salivary proline-rich protein 2-like n=1 Tax=Chiloscyllium plagiosum TaxID=36176 RepID=UPI001CB85881
MNGIHWSGQKEERSSPPPPLHPKSPPLHLPQCSSMFEAYHRTRDNGPPPSHTNRHSGFEFAHGTSGAESTRGAGAERGADQEPTGAERGAVPEPRGAERGADPEQPRGAERGADPEPRGAERGAVPKSRGAERGAVLKSRGAERCADPEPRGAERGADPEPSAAQTGSPVPEWSREAEQNRSRRGVCVLAFWGESCCPWLGYVSVYGLHGRAAKAGPEPGSG